MARFLFKIGEDKMKNKTLKGKREEIYNSKWCLEKKKVKIFTGDLIEGCEEWYWFFPEKDVKQCFKKILEEIKILQHEPYHGFEDQTFEAIKQVISEHSGFEE